MDEARARMRIHTLQRRALLGPLREDTGLSQGDVARSIDVNQSQVSRWEAGKSLPRGDHALALLELLEGS